MRYIRADEILPSELLEAIQQYVDGQLIYIPSKEKHKWGSGTASRKYYCERNRKIFRLLLKNGGFIDSPVLWMLPCSLPDFEEEILVIPDSVGFSSDVLDKQIRSFQRSI